MSTGLRMVILNKDCDEEVSIFMRPTRVTIDLSALVHNLNCVREIVGPGVGIMGIVKSDAYGHGLIPVSRVLEKNGVDSLGVGYVEEALELRKEGIEVPIVILCGVNTIDEVRLVVERDLTPVIYDVKAAEMLEREGEGLERRVPVLLKVDTGMGRLGISREEMGAFLKRLKTCRHLRLQGLCSHLSSADEEDRTFTNRQKRAFEKALEHCHEMGMELTFNNLANSAGILGHEGLVFDYVRPGIILYGGLPSPDWKSPLSLRPVMHFSGRVLQIRELEDKSPVSYGRTYYTKGPQRIAVVSVGYGDGLPRSLSNEGRVLIRGEEASIVGRVCMNLTMCDITGHQRVSVGDEVVFLGSQGKRTITGDDLAKWAGTISYEVFCSIGRSNRKEYIA